MSATETLRTQLDNLRIEKQQLEVQNVHLRNDRPNQAALVDVEEERDELQKAKDDLETELLQLRTVYDQLLRDSQEDQRTLEMLKSEVREAREMAELERYRAVEKERAKWEEREAQLLAQLNEAQSRMVEEQGRGGQEFQDNLSYSNWEEEDEGGHLFQDSGAARARVTFSAPVTTVSVASPEAQPSVLISGGACRSVNNVSPGGSYQSEVLIARSTSRPETKGVGRGGVQGVTCNPPFKLMVFMEVCHA